MRVTSLQRPPLPAPSTLGHSFMPLPYYDVMSASKLCCYHNKLIVGILILPLVMVISEFVVYVFDKGIVFEVTLPHFYNYTFLYVICKYIYSTLLRDKAVFRMHCNGLLSGDIFVLKCLFLHKR